MKNDLMTQELEGMLAGNQLSASDRLQAITALITLRLGKGERSENVAKEVVSSAPKVIAATDTPVANMPLRATERAALRMGRRSRP